MKTIKVNRNFNGKRLVTRVVAIVISIIGTIICLPFIYHVGFASHEPYLSLFKFFSIIMFMAGLPMFFYGIIGFFAAGKSGVNNLTSQSSDIDVARIRYAAETEVMVGKK